MRKVFVFCAVVCALASTATAQLTVQVRTLKDTFLLYEAIPLVVSIHNYSGHTIQMEDQAGGSWLTFLVAGESSDLVPSVGKLDTREPALVAAGDTISRTIDLLPLYDLREHGTYQVQAVVRVNSAEAISSPVRLTIVKGRDLWSQTVGLPPKEKGDDEYRTYSLVARSSSAEPDLLYICVREEAHQLVYGLVPLGEYIPLAEPEAQVDKSGNLHVLYQNGARSFAYVQVDPYAKVADKAVYSDLVSRPQLASQDGIITVQGGEKIFPKPDEVMTHEDTSPPPAKPKPKKHWWWPFGP